MNNNNLIKLDTDVISNIVNDMMLARFNDNNQLINNIRNHVSFNNDIENSIPQIQDKIDLINSFKTPVQQSPVQQIQSQQIPVQQIQSQQEYCEQNNNIQENIEKEINNCPTKIQIVKLSIISIFIIAIICFIIWKYIESKYIYVIMIICGSIILCSDYIIYKKGWIFLL